MSGDRLPAIKNPSGFTTKTESVVNIPIVEYICEYSLRIIFIFVFEVKSKTKTKQKTFVFVCVVD